MIKCLLSPVSGPLQGQFLLITFFSCVWVNFIVYLHVSSIFVETGYFRSCIVAAIDSNVPFPPGMTSINVCLFILFSGFPALILEITFLLLMSFCSVAFWNFFLFSFLSLARKGSPLSQHNLVASHSLVRCCT